MRSPPRGELWLVDLGLSAKVRPCVVLSVATTDSDRALITLVPHTTSARGPKFEVVVPARFLKAGAFDAQGLVTVPHDRLVGSIGTLAAIQLQDVEAAVRTWLGLVTPNPSFKRSANGMPPSPAWRYAVHFHQSGLGVLPLVPPQLER